LREGSDEEIMGSSIEDLVELAKEGDRDALEAVIGKIQDRVYGLAMRMLYHPADAEDATQEILMKVVTHLGTFRRESAFYTWVYRMASNHLLRKRKSRAELKEITFDLCETQVDQGLANMASGSAPEAEQAVIVEEMMIGCMQATLLCLKRDLRITFVLAEMFEVTSTEGAYILDITPAAFRKRLSRARALIQDFMIRMCGLVNVDNPCRCARQATYAVKTGWINPDNLLLAGHPRHDRPVGVDPDKLQQMDELQRVTALFRSLPDYEAPTAFVNALNELMDSARLRLYGR
jgi:RNA polymerase sigma factor (sigma-70 family)